MKNISFMGAVYSDVPAVILPDAGGGVARFDDASITTATASDVASGKVFLAADGTITTGTSSGGGGSSSWTKIAEKSYQISTTSTTAETVETWATGHSEIWQSNKIVYARVRDTAGRRSGYFYGSEQYFYLQYSKNDATTTSSSNSLRIAIRNINNLYQLQYTTGTTGYGVYVDYVYANGDVRVRKRYNSTYAPVVNGTYKVEIYLLEPAGNISIFE